MPFRGTLECELDQLKARLLRQVLEQAGDPELNAPLRRAANEAASLAWFTPFPLLVFPLLLDEKAQEVQRQAARQREIRQRSAGSAQNGGRMKPGDLYGWGLCPAAAARRLAAARGEWQRECRSSIVNLKLVN